MMRLILSLLLTAMFFSPTFSLAGDTKAKLSDFKKVKLKMLKTEVIRLLMSPKKSYRWKGKDRWVYYFFNKSSDGVVSQIVKEVHFLDGLVEYMGPPKKPKKSAAEQDAENLQADLQALDDWEAHKQKAKDSRDAYRKYVQEVHNKSPEKAYVPQFKSVD